MTATRMHAADIVVRGLVQRFGGNTVLDGVDIDVPAGTVLALLGPSGCGKSTLLKLLAGLDRPVAGHISFGGRPMSGDGLCLPPEQRDLGMVFQDYALWPHMTVARNVAFPLQMRGVGRAECDARVQEALHRVGLAAMAPRRPSELSGGQQQRVALARAIVARPAVLLFDEPLSNLDRDLRESLCAEIGALLASMGTTAVYVTHDHSEAEALAHRIARMAGGAIREIVATSRPLPQADPSAAQVPGAQPRPTSSFA